MGTAAGNILAMNDTTVFATMFRAYYAPLCYFTENIISDADEAEDIVESLFLRLWERQKEFKSADDARYYLYRCARNAALNYLKHEKHRTNVHEGLSMTATLEETGHLEQMIHTEVWAEIYRAIHQLPSQCNKVISLSYIEGKTNHEIAEELRLSHQTIKNYKLRGLQILKKNLPENLLILLVTYHFLN